MGLPTAELQALTNKSVIELYTLTLVSALHGSTDVTRFHSGVGMNSNASIIWQGNTYDKFPIKDTLKVMIDFIILDMLCLLFNLK